MMLADKPQAPPGQDAPKNGLMQIGALARRAGITLRTVRYYEQLGLIQYAVRTKGGFRLYEEAELRKLRLIRDLQALDFPLARIRALFARKREARSGAELAPDVRASLNAQLEELDGRIARYHVMRTAILETMAMVQVCADCPLQPTPAVCGVCPVVTSRAEVPLPMQALISVS